MSPVSVLYTPEQAAPVQNSGNEIRHRNIRFGQESAKKFTPCYYIEQYLSARRRGKKSYPVIVFNFDFVFHFFFRLLLAVLRLSRQK